MPVSFDYPTSAELIEVAQDKMPRLIQNRPCFNIFPVRSVESHLLKWDQLDNYQGLQQVRGLGGAPGRVSKTGQKSYLMEPGVYGEFETIDEVELTARRQVGTFGTPIDISDLVMMSQDKLLGRRLDRIEFIIWKLLTTGAFSIPGPNGAVLHTDTFPLQTYIAPFALTNATQSAPLFDMRQVQLKNRGHSVNFGAGAKAYINRVTTNNMLNNANPTDLYGRRTEGLGTYNTLQQVNQLFAGDDLPMFETYDEGYLSDGTDGNAAGTFVPFIPNGAAVIIGQRPAGQTVGEYRMTRNANNPNMAPGPYMRVIDRGENHVPRSIEVHDGHNGGPAVFFPSAIVVLSGW